MMTGQVETMWGHTPRSYIPSRCVRFIPTGRQDTSHSKQLKFRQRRLDKTEVLEPDIIESLKIAFKIAHSADMLGRVQFYCSRRLVTVEALLLVV